MIKNYLKIAFRSLWKTKIHTLINIGGLGLGIAACVLIVLFVKDEWSFDTFHTKADRIYRVFVKEDWGENEQFFNTVTPFPMGPTLKENFEDVEYQVRLQNVGTSVRIGEDLFRESVLIVGKDFLESLILKPFWGMEMKRCKIKPD
ncbi:MAG: ABC transporter permease [Flammeovirgaceae bacterium]|nr:ABC transporter permease [Flammeovirgaceae bacterium]